MSTREISELLATIEARVTTTVGHAAESAVIVEDGMKRVDELRTQQVVNSIEQFCGLVHENATSAGNLASLADQLSRQASVMKDLVTVSSHEKADAASPSVPAPREVPVPTTR